MKEMHTMSDKTTNKNFVLTFDIADRAAKPMS